MVRCPLHASCRSITTSGAGPSRANFARQASGFRLPPRDPPENEASDARLDLTSLLDTLAGLKQDGRRPSSTAYGDLLRLAAQLHRFRSRYIVQGTEPALNVPTGSLEWKVADAAVKDAARGKVDLAPTDYDHLLRFTQTHPATLPYLLREVPHGVRGSEQVLLRLCHVAIQQNNLDGLLPILTEMLSRRISPTTVITGHAIRLSCDLGLSRLALDLADRFESSSTLGLEVPFAAWSRILRSSAETCFFAGVERAWSRTVASRKLVPDEGLLVNVMNVAARAGKPEMVSQVLEAFSDLSIDPQEHHLAALLEAYVNAGQVPRALQVLSTIRAASLVPTSATAQPIVAVLKSTEVVDQAFWALEDLKVKGERIDVTALNVVLEASAKLGDIQRVRATQIAAVDLDVTLNVDSFNQVLSICASTSNRKLADTVMKEMTDAGVAANGTTYHHMLVCCLSQTSYEDAFFFLEKSKSEGFKPSAEAYQRLANKCESSRDSRARLVVQEAESLGYKVDPLRRAEGKRRSS